jgi:hypothetical protein
MMKVICGRYVLTVIEVKAPKTYNKLHPTGPETKNPPVRRVFLGLEGTRCSKGLIGR